MLVCIDSSNGVFVAVAKARAERGNSPYMYLIPKFKVAWYFQRRSLDSCTYWVPVELRKLVTRQVG